jgi:hypothetical protein
VKNAVPDEGMKRTLFGDIHLSATSTFRPSSSSRSAGSPPGNHGGVCGPASTSKSRSLSSRASPLAKEPNTRTRRTPCSAAMARIAQRLFSPNPSRVIRPYSLTCHRIWASHASDLQRSALDAGAAEPGMPLL